MYGVVAHRVNRAPVVLTAWRTPREARSSAAAAAVMARHGSHPATFTVEPVERATGRGRGWAIVPRHKVGANQRERTTHGS